MKIKILMGIISVFCLLTLSASPAEASPENENKAVNNPQVVAYHPEGVHAVVGEEGDTHTGSDLVMQAGEGGVFQQWFLGESESEGSHGEHSVWVPATNGECANGWVYVTEPYPEWGDYFPAGVDYCVHTNDYALGNSF